MVHCIFTILGTDKPLSYSRLCWGTAQHIQSNDKIPEMKIFYSKVIPLIESLRYRVNNNVVWKKKVIALCYIEYIQKMFCSISSVYKFAQFYHNNTFQNLHFMFLEFTWH